MGYVNDAFAKMKSNLEITTTEQSLASRSHTAIRDHLNVRWSLADDFLTGSYKRDTKTKKLKDVDIFVVIDRDGDQATYANSAPRELLQALLVVIREKWSDAFIDGMAVVVPFGTDEEIVSMDVVPAFERSGGGYLIPDATAGKWIATDPTVHEELSTQMNKSCDAKYVPFVKMAKGANRELGEPVKPSFLLEVMAQDIVRPPFGTYQDELVMFFATAAERIHEPFDDPAGLGGNVNVLMTADDIRIARSALESAQRIAEVAVDLEDEGQERSAVEEWRKLFGDRMPRP